MNKKYMIKISCILIVISVVVYGIQIALFHDSRNTLFYMFQDMAFMPVTIAIATLLVGYLLDKKSKQDKIERTRILSCSFYSIIGNQLMSLLNSILDEKQHVQWDADVFQQIFKLLDTNRDSILIIASNPHLLEHEEFTDLLWAVLHLREELFLRPCLELTEADRLHLCGDAQRVYQLFKINWVEYRDYVKKEYPYFYKRITGDHHGTA